MLRILTESVTAEVSTTLIKDLSLVPPSKGFLNILSKILVVFKDKEKLINNLKACYARALNMMLIRTDKN